MTASRTSTRQRLIDTAYELFARNGFHAIGLDRILDEVGVSKQTFYNHFECKDDLVLAVLEKRSQWELQSLRQMLHSLGGDDPNRQLHALFDVLEAWFSEPDFRGCIFITAAAEFPMQHDPAHQSAARHSRAIQQMLRGLSERAGVTDPQALAAELMILIEGAFVVRHVTGNDRAAQIGRSIAESLFARYLPRSAAQWSGVLAAANHVQALPE
ncbi:MAG TPA: TetR/AcrR family transcriptional regulator [Tepidisphaeraceae bacterium]|nr:TetR/AcrR family transcriptional regulator [Tepidisphaeraceae bacterium]